MADFLDELGKTLTLEKPSRRENNKCTNRSKTKLIEEEKSPIEQVGVKRDQSRMRQSKKDES